jgi:hypothetical protein
VLTLVAIKRTAKTAAIDLVRISLVRISLVRIMSFISAPDR